MGLCPQGMVRSLLRKSYHPPTSLVELFVGGELLPAQIRLAEQTVYLSKAKAAIETGRVETQ